MSATAAPDDVGLVTRALAFSVDAAIINVAAAAGAAALALAASVTGLSATASLAAAVTCGAAYVVWSAAYFTTFWSTTGQTPGSRLLRIRVEPAAGGGLRVRRALLRFAGLILAALPLLAGYLLILVDDRRRGLHDRLARTVVVEAPVVSAVAGTRRAPGGAASAGPAPPARP
jgi:uncharacterized RDD family membrane protein YckC